MSHPRFRTITEQVAEHLREELLSGHWQDGMPGQKLLSKQLGVSGQTVELALQLLEKEGLLVGQGAGRRRRIELSQGATRNRALRVRILLYDGSDRKTDYLLELFHRCLDALFRHTPPTAMLIDEAHLFIAAQMHLAQLGIIAPRDVSLVCLDPNPAFAWCQPSIAHFHWEGSLLVRRITRWANNVARGIDDRRKSVTKAEFIEGGTVGPAPTGR